MSHRKKEHDKTKKARHVTKQRRAQERPLGDHKAVTKKKPPCHGNPTKQDIHDPAWTNHTSSALTLAALAETTNKSPPGRTHTSSSPGCSSGAVCTACPHRGCCCGGGVALPQTDGSVLRPRRVRLAVGGVPQAPDRPVVPLTKERTTKSWVVYGMGLAAL